MDEEQVGTSALARLRVIELPCLDPLGNFAAAMAAKMFADLGAEVIKLEPPAIGSAERNRSPFKNDLPDPETAGLHLYLNPNKLSVTLDLRSARGREVLERLSGGADILLNPNPPRVSDELGLKPDGLLARHPRLIVVSLTPFGERTPYRNWRGSDLIATHLSGVGYDTPINQVTDPDNQPPLKPADRQADYLAGITGAAAAMCALFHRKRTGRGQHVDASMWLAMVSMMRPALGIYSHELPTAPYGVRVRTRAKLGMSWVLPCADGWVSFSALYDRFWRGTKIAMGNPEWAENEMFSTLKLRATNYDAIEAALTDWLSTHSKDEVFRSVQAEHVPCFPVYAPDEVANNPHYRERGFFVHYQHPVAGTVTVPGTPCVLERTPAKIRRPAPRLGEHNRLIDTGWPKPPLDRELPVPGRSHEAQDSLPFAGIRVADFGWIFAVPHATAWLGALGAEVIRIETTVAPDLSRTLSGTDGEGGLNRSGIFHSINFCHKSITLNLSSSEGRRIALELVRRSDIATENFTVGNMKKFGLSYPDLRRVKPDLIMLAGTPLGQTGPYAATVGWGPTTQAFAGMCHLTGYPGQFPCGTGAWWPDFEVGAAMVFYLLAALHHRDLTGEGQYLDVSMAEMVTATLPEAMMDYFLNSRVRGPAGNRDGGIAPHGVFRVRGEDRWVAIAVGGDEEFASLCEVLGVPLLARDQRFRSNAARLANEEQLEKALGARTVGFERDDLVRALQERNIAAGPVFGVADLMTDRGFLDSAMLVELEHKESGRRTIPGLPVGFSAIAPRYFAAPAIGQHSEAVLSEVLGYSDEHIASLRKQRVVI